MAGRGGAPPRICARRPRRFGRCWPASAPGPSLTVAAFGDGAVRVAARLADRMVINLCTPALAGLLRERLDGFAAEAGVEAPPLAAWIPASVDPDEQAIAQLSRGAVPYLA